MKNRSASLAMFIAWFVCCTLIPKVVRSWTNPPDLAMRMTEEQLSKKLYTRFNIEAVEKETTFKRQIELLEVQERKVDQQIKLEQGKIVQWKTESAIAAKNNIELQMEEQLLANQALKEPARRDEINKQIQVLRTRRDDNKKQIDQYAAWIKESTDKIERLSKYPLGWKFGDYNFKTIPEAKQHYSLALTKVEAEKSATQQRYDAWVSSKTSDNLTAFITAYTAADGTSCSVEIMSEKNKQETTDATVRYQTPEQRQYGARPKTAKSKTKCLDEKMKPDRYYMWTERDGKETSSREELFPIGSEKEKVTIAEW